MLSRASVYFVISKLILLFSYSFHVPCIILSNVSFYIVLRSMFPFPFNRSQSKASVVNQMNHLFLKLKNICLLFSTLKFHVQNNNIVSALATVVNINVEIDNVNLMLFNVVNFNVYIHNAVSMLIRYYPMSRDLITLTTTLRQR